MRRALTKVAVMMMAAISLCDVRSFALTGWDAAVEQAVPGSRLRCRQDQVWCYGQVLEASQQELLVQWDDERKGPEKIGPSTVGEVEILDPAQSILQRLEEHRMSDVIEAAAQEDEPEAMLFTLEDIKDELDAFRFITNEVVTRRLELERLEEENQRMREEQESLRQRYEDMMEQAESDMHSSE